MTRKNLQTKHKKLHQVNNILGLYLSCWANSLPEAFRSLSLLGIQRGIQDIFQIFKLKSLSKRWRQIMGETASETKKWSKIRSWRGKQSQSAEVRGLVFVVFKCSIRFLRRVGVRNRCWGVLGWEKGMPVNTRGSVLAYVMPTSLTHLFTPVSFYTAKTVFRQYNEILVY